MSRIFASGGALMSKQAQILFALSLVSMSFALREQKRLDESKRRFAALFPDDAATLVIDVDVDVEVTQ
jgi:hypothetical protein